MKYQVKRPIRFNGKDLKVGEPIDVDGRTEAELLGIGAIGPAERPAKPTGGRTQQNKPAPASTIEDSTSGGGAGTSVAGATQSGIDLDSLA